MKTGAAGVSAAFGVALNLPLGHTLATFDSASGIVVPASPALDPGTGAGRTAAGKVGATCGPLSDVLTLGFARLNLGANSVAQVAVPQSGFALGRLYTVAQ